MSSLLRVGRPTVRALRALLLLPALAGCGLLLDTDPQGSDGRPTADGGTMDGRAGRPDAMPVDAQRADGAPCLAVVESCDGADNDCDGAVDEGFELSADLENCGACSRSCAGTAFGYPTCIDGACGVTCRTGYDDCGDDGTCDPLDDPAHCGDCDTPCTADELCRVPASGGAACGACMGAEVCGGACVDTVTDERNCGGCGVICSPDNATGACAGGECAIAVCDPGWSDCNAMPEDGCEKNTLTDPANCGDCGATCPSTNGVTVCRNGMCEITSCPGGLLDCNGAVFDGCEVNTLTDPANCGSCGRSCPFGCAVGICVPSVVCGVPCFDCDGTGACDDDIDWNDEHCGGCNMPCAAAEHCCDGTCSLALCGSTPLRCGL